MFPISSKVLEVGYIFMNEKSITEKFGFLGVFFTASLTSFEDGVKPHVERGCKYQKLQKEPFVD